MSEGRVEKLWDELILYKKNGMKKYVFAKPKRPPSQPINDSLSKTIRMNRFNPLNLSLTLLNQSSICHKAIASNTGLCNKKLLQPTGTQQLKT